MRLITITSLERNHCVLNEYLLNFVDDYEWDKWIPYYAFAYNTTPHVNNDYSPYELIFGKLPTLSFGKISSNEKKYDLYNYCNALKLRLSTSINKAKKFVDIAKHKSKLTYDKYTANNNFEVGDLFW